MSAKLLAGGRKRMPRHQKGTLVSRPDYWVGRWYIDEVEDGKVERVRTWHILGDKKTMTLRQAENALARFVAEVNSETYQPLHRITFAQFHERWEKHAKAAYQKRYQMGMSSRIKCHLLPFFDKMLLSEIGPEKLQEFVSWCVNKEKPIHPGSIKATLVALRSMWDQAHAWGLVQHSPFARTITGKLLLKIPRAAKSKTYAFTLDEAQQILAELAKIDEKWVLFVRIFALTGMRPGELCGLRRTDLDGQMVSIWQSVYMQKLLDRPKTDAAIRRFPIEKQLADDLRDYMQRTENLRNPHGLIFLDYNGRPIHMDKFRNRVFEPILVKLGIREKLKALGIKNCGVYAFRHMHITELIRKGIPLKTIQERVGHVSGSKVTELHYLHAVSEDGLRAADAIALLNPKTGGGRIQ